MKRSRLGTHSKPPSRMPLASPEAKTPLAERMLSELGAYHFSVLKTFQAHLGAKVVHYQDAKGEVGIDPRWPA